MKAFGRFEIPAAALAEITVLQLSADGQRDHPVTGHRTFGTPTAEELNQFETTFQGELGCLSCHDPHKGASAQLFRWGVATPSQACIQCHPK